MVKVISIAFLNPNLVLQFSLFLSCSSSFIHSWIVRASAVSTAAFWPCPGLGLSPPEEVPVLVSSGGLGHCTESMLVTQIICHVAYELRAAHEVFVFILLIE